MKRSWFVKTSSGTAQDVSPRGCAWRAVMVMLKEFRDLILNGWPIEEKENELVRPKVIFIDSGYMAPVVYEFCRKRENINLYWPCIGRGAGQQRLQHYTRPMQRTDTTRFIGRDFHINFLPSENTNLVEINADYWKTWVHQRLTQPLDKPGAMTLFQAPRELHIAIAKHLSAEVKSEEFVPGKGSRGGMDLPAASEPLLRRVVLCFGGRLVLRCAATR